MVTWSILVPLFAGRPGPGHGRRTQAGRVVPVRTAAGAAGDAANLPQPMRLMVQVKVITHIGPANIGLALTNSA